MGEFCGVCLREECDCTGEWYLDDRFRPPEPPPERPWRVSVSLDGTRTVQCPFCDSFGAHTTSCPDLEAV